MSIEDSHISGTPCNKNLVHSHIVTTYTNLRIGMALLAFALPVLLLIVGKQNGVEPQNSISAYYWAVPAPNADTESTPVPGCRPPMRAWFVGMLLGVAALLYLYKGYSRKENFALNASSMFAVGVAVFPMEWGCGDQCQKLSVHGTCAVAMFACLAYVVWFRSSDSLEHLPRGRRQWFRWLYILTGLVMALSPLAVLVMNSIRLGEDVIFRVEVVAIYSFGLYWAIKTKELLISMQDSCVPIEPDIRRHTGDLPDTSCGKL